MVHFLIHDTNDTVGVAVVDLRAGEQVTGRATDTQETVTVRTASDIPLGHKIALREHRVGDTVIKYGHDIGRVVAAIATGDHVHVHNLKTKRW
jgi:(2R)-sulfolactate sulfo-lyase subunit alpha